jgi:hypothetical protein
MAYWEKVHVSSRTFSRGSPNPDPTLRFEEHASSTGVIAAVEGGSADCPGRTRIRISRRSALKLLPLLRAPASGVIGIAARRRGRASPAVERFFSTVRQSTAA